jgi:hypothetical protein
LTWSKGISLFYPIYLLPLYSNFGVEIFSMSVFLSVFEIFAYMLSLGYTWFYLAISATLFSYFSIRDTEGSSFLDGSAYSRAVFSILDSIIFF